MSPADLEPAGISRKRRYPCGSAAVLALAVTACGGSPSTPTAIPIATPSPGVAPSAVATPAPTGPTGEVSGVVVDTDGRPIAGARLMSSSSLAAVDVQTDASGAFAFTYPLSLAHVNAAMVTVGAPGYEAHDVAWRSSPEPVILRVVLQRTIAIEARTEVTVELTANDLSYYVGEPYGSDYCGPCKRIRLGDGPVNSGARVTLRWAGDDALQMWASNGLDVRRAEADGERSQVTTLGSSDVIYVGLPLGPDHKRQQLTAPARFQLSVQ